MQEDRRMKRRWIGMRRRRRRKGEGGGEGG